MPQSLTNIHPLATSFKQYSGFPLRSPPSHTTRLSLYLPLSLNDKSFPGMQGLPFDDAEFPPPGSTGTSCWDQSPRVPNVNVNQTTTHPPPVTDEELYRLVGAPPPEPTATQDELIRYSQQMSLAAAQHLQSFPQHSQPQQTHARQRQDIHYRSIAQAPQLQQHHSTGPRIPVTAATAIHQAASASRHVTHDSRTRQRSSIAHSPPQQLQASRTAASQQPMRMTVAPSVGSVDGQGQPQAHVSRQSVAAAMTVSPGGGSSLGHRESPKRPKRSAVEEARIRAQREAETFANSRRGDTTKREVSLQSGGKGGDGTGGEGSSSMRQSSKRMKVEMEPNSSNEYHSSRKKSVSGDEGRRKDDESEAEKKERYKRRLDMNRESAAVSRVRRRAYVKELEERLAAVEAEKLQLEGKLEIMFSQNESLKKQLENLFLMVASGRRPTYPGSGPGDSSIQGPTGQGAPPSGSGEGC